MIIGEAYVCGSFFDEPRTIIYPPRMRCDWCFDAVSDVLERVNMMGTYFKVPKGWLGYRKPVTKDNCNCPGEGDVRMTCMRHGHVHFCCQEHYEKGYVRFQDAEARLKESL